jgi:hypothetical protein
MSLAQVFDTLGQTVMPQVAAAVFADTADVFRDILTSDGAGGQIASDNDNNRIYYDVPISYKPRNSRIQKFDAGDQITSLAEYQVMMPTHHQAAKITLYVNDRIVCHERGNEAEKLFRIRSVKNSSGVIYDLACDLENEA